MFDKKEFAHLLKTFSDNYSNQRDFAEKVGVNRTYLSQYINMKLDEPPSPKILKKIAEATYGVNTYYKLMSICGYIDLKNVFLKTKDGYDTNLAYWYKEDLRDRGISAEDIKKIENIIFDNSIEDKETQISVILSNYPKDIFNNFVEKVLISNRIIWEKEYFKPEKRAKYYPCPVYGQISAGQPNWAEENLEGYLPLDPELMGIVNPEEHYFLRVNGESMNKVIKNGAFALIHKQDYVDNGEIAVVFVNGNNATLKRFTKEGNIIVLTPESTDDSFKQQVYTKDTDVRIIGKYVGKMEFNQ